MRSLREEFIFTALDNFKECKDPKSQLKNAKRFGIRIVEANCLTPADYRVIRGPFWRFRRRIDKLILGADDDYCFFIRKVVATRGSNTKLYYYDLKTGRDAIVEIARRPGLHLTFRSGKPGDLYLEVDMMCAEDHHLTFLSFGDKFEVL